MELTLEDLAREVAARIQRGGVRQGNGQVSPFPDRRTLRYYTTIGLLDRPLAIRGRQAMYGERHVHQAVAVKRMQAGGLSLGEIQTRLAGLPTPELARVAEADIASDAHPRGRWWAAPVLGSAASSGPGTVVDRSAGAGARADAGTGAGAVAGTGGTRVNARWTVNTTARRALMHDDGGSSAVTPTSAGFAAPLPPAAGPAEVAEPATTLTALPLGAGATLLVPAGRPLTGADLDAIRRAATPLTDYLAAAGLTAARPDPKDPR